MTTTNKIQYKIGDTVTTATDNHKKDYQGTIINIKRMMHPHRSDNKLFTFYEIEYGFRAGSFLTCDKTSFK